VIVFISATILEGWSATGRREHSGGRVSTVQLWGGRRTNTRNHVVSQRRPNWGYVCDEPSTLLSIHTLCVNQSVYIWWPVKT